MQHRVRNNSCEIINEVVNNTFKDKKTCFYNYAPHTKSSATYGPLVAHESFCFYNNSHQISINPKFMQFHYKTKNAPPERIYVNKNISDDPLTEQEVKEFCHERAIFKHQNNPRNSQKENGDIAYYFPDGFVLDVS